MELEGLRPGLEFLDNMRVCVSTAIIGHHTQIESYLKKEHYEITRSFDVLDVSKGC